MKNLDVDLYITQFRGFFDKNPNDLLSLIGDVLVEDFFKRVEEQCYKNLEKGDEVSLKKLKKIFRVQSQKYSNILNLETSVLTNYNPQVLGVFYFIIF